MDFIFSKMTEKDATEVCKIENELIGNSSYKTILDTLKSDKLNYYVLKNGTEIIGFLEILLIAPECELYDIAIKKEYQGRGYSKILIDNLLKLLKENQVATIFLEVNSINYKAINLYEKYGFKEYSIRKNYYGDNDAILMKLDM